MSSSEHQSDGTTSSSTDRPLYIVAMGASAGGLDALERLLSDLPTDTGAAFVVIQHLSPDHKSMMASLLARYTSMPVLMVENDTRIQPNHLYLIPPAALMYSDGQCLRLRPKVSRSLTLPIDVFFQSMATHHGRYAVGVVLSGTGSDGTRGASAINEAGGFLLAQTPENAKFDGMPRSVIATGLVDAVLPVEQMAQRIVAHVQNPRPAARDEEALERTATFAVGVDVALGGILHLLMQMGGVNFEEYKPGTVMRRIERRMAVHQLDTLPAYLNLLNKDRAEVLALRRELLIPVTSFFRDTEAFETLATQVVAPLVAAKQAGESIRVWCAAVSTGEEAYSIAMLFLEAFEQAKRWPTLKIFATDVDQTNIDTASMGSYPESIMAEVSAQQLERFFAKKGNRFVVKNELRQCIVFARHNLLSDPPFTKIDLAVCRNALIYFRNVAQDKALLRLQYALGARGYLFLGSSESLGELHRDFQTLSVRHKIWQVVRPTALPLDVARSSGQGPLTLGMREHTPRKSPNRHPPSVVELGYATLTKAFPPPPAILVNAGHELLHSYGDVHRFLRIREGLVTLDLNRMLPDALVPVAAALLFKCSRENAPVGSDLIRLPEHGQDPSGTQMLRLSAWPVAEQEGQRYNLLMFEAVHNHTTLDKQVAVDVDSEHLERIEVLERELAATRESLQATIEELETSNEELQATNEEMMSSNEELQSSNEELQSINEELNTVNAEYHGKIEILNRVNADLDNLIRVASDCTVFVDEHLNLTRYNPKASQIFRLRHSDLGRPLDDLVHSLDYPSLMQDLRRTLVQESPFEVSCTGGEGRHFLIKMLPYRIPSSALRGVVLSFIDTTSLREASFLQSVLDALAENVVVLNPEGLIVMVNRSWLAFASENGASATTSNAIGVNYLKVCEACRGQDADYAMQAVQGIRAVLSGQQPSFSMEYPCHSPTQQRWFVMNVSGLHGPDGGRLGAVVSHVNISAWRVRQSV